MTEHRIFELLLKNNTNSDYTFDYPKLQEETVNIIAKKCTNIIYETLKQKSSASNIRRGNVLKFISNLCDVKEAHLNEENYKYFMKVVENSFKTAEDEDIIKLCCETEYDLDQHVSNNLSDNIVMFYKKKHSKQKEKIKHLEFTKMMDQEKLNEKFDIQLRRNFNYYETNENLIRELVGETIHHQTKFKTISYRTENSDFREKQIKLAYAIINLSHQEHVNIMGTILQRLSAYKKLREFEVNFLQYLWLIEDGSISLCLQDIIVERFPFVLERQVMKYSTEIISLSEETDLYKYFTDLEGDKKVMRLRRICSKNPVLYYKLKSLIYELYCYSFCNVNVLKLSDFII